MLIASRILKLRRPGGDIEAHQAGDLVWDKPGNGYGFPVSAGIRDLLQGDDAKYL